MNWRRLAIRILAIALVGLVLLIGISQWSDSTAGEKDSV
jgi:hypothetical protein